MGETYSRCHFMMHWPFLNVVSALSGHISNIISVLNICFSPELIRVAVKCLHLSSVFLLQYVLDLLYLNTVSYGFINALRLNWMQHGLHDSVFSVAVQMFFSKRAETFRLHVRHLPRERFFLNQVLICRSDVMYTDIFDL